MVQNHPYDNIVSSYLDHNQMSYRVTRKTRPCLTGHPVGPMGLPTTTIRSRRRWPLTNDVTTPSLTSLLIPWHHHDVNTWSLTTQWRHHFTITSPLDPWQHHDVTTWSLTAIWCHHLTSPRRHHLILDNTMTSPLTPWQHHDVTTVSMTSPTTSPPGPLNHSWCRLHRWPLELTLNLLP